MLDSIDFVKLSGSGNDFVCLDNRNGRYDAVLDDARRAGQFARELCHRGTGVGADGVIVAGDPTADESADIAARFFEADGSEAELCGNGTACFAHWVISEGFVGTCEVRVLTPAGIVQARNCDPPYVRVCIPSPRDIRRDVAVRADGRRWLCDTVVVGIPHAITYVDDVDALEVSHWGPALRWHERFAPKGTNVNFVQVLGPGRIRLRTFEYGVEGETLACGTGSAAAAILTALRFGWREHGTDENPIRIEARSGDVLRVSFAAGDDGAIDDVCLSTVVRFVYTGTLHPSLAARALGQAPAATAAADPVPQPDAPHTQREEVRGER